MQLVRAESFMIRHLGDELFIQEPIVRDIWQDFWDIPFTRLVIQLLELTEGLEMCVMSSDEKDIACYNLWQPLCV